MLTTGITRGTDRNLYMDTNFAGCNLNGSRSVSEDTSSSDGSLDLEKQVVLRVECISKLSVKVNSPPDFETADLSAWLLTHTRRRAEICLLAFLLEICLHLYLDSLSQFHLHQRAVQP